jgi:hypothetical protein
MMRHRCYERTLFSAARPLTPFIARCLAPRQDCEQMEDERGRRRRVSGPADSEQFSRPEEL